MTQSDRDPFVAVNFLLGGASLRQWKESRFIMVSYVDRIAVSSAAM